MYGNRTLLTALLAPALATPLVLAEPAMAQTRLTGRVLGEGGQPLSQVFVQQQGSLATTFTDDQGRFTLALDPNGRKTLELSAVGYQSRIVTTEAAGARAITLELIPTYQPSYAPVVPERIAPEIPLMDTQVGLAYRLRNLTVAHQGQRVEGSVDNELYAQGQLRRGSALFGLEAFRFKAPTTVPNTQPSSPLARPEVTDVKLRGGLAFGTAAWEVAPSLALFQENVTPNNGGIPYTGTLLDFSQTRRGLGLSVPAIVSLGRIELLGEAAYFPWTWVTLDGAPYSVGSSNRVDLRWGVGYRVTPVVRADLSVTRHMWRGGFEQTSDVLGLGLTYRPERTEDRE